ncbi:MAG: multiheme c-type cytochrome [Mariprofundaceae bacterium]|nr:multiheme c-type cytochrome [Mariprofundaceae bacterium]
MKKGLLLLIFALLGGVGLLAVSQDSNSDSGLPEGYWDSPAATTGKAPHDWSKLEADLRPEACAQCHAEQFDAWKSTRHAAAYSSGLVGQFAAMGHAGANDCLQCHAPLAEQLYADNADMLDSVKLRLTHPTGFPVNGEITDAVASNQTEKSKLPLRHSGVSCAVCHVRGWQRHGPPQRGTGATGQVDGPAHGGFSATADFEKSQFCASCHQFPQSMAINGKPLENTLEEWKQSRFAKDGVHCQQCHMPDRKHEFRGIHDAEMVKKGLTFKLSERAGQAVFAITSKWIGHAFPTYVTPQIIVRAEALDAAGKSLQTWQWEIVREVYYNNGWKEKRDTRLMPGERREFVAADLPEGATHIRYRVQVIPDNFYKGVYESLLSDDMQPVAARHIRQATRDADANDYLLYEKELVLTPAQ